MGFPFGGFQILFFLVFFLVLVMIVVQIVRGLGQWNRNNHSPRLSVWASVAGKRMEVSHHHHHQADGIDHVHTSTSYYVTFQVESGDRMEFLVDGREYGMLAEGDSGQLTFQGTRYLGFVRGTAMGSDE
jgi:hypothetical protein